MTRVAVQLNFAVRHLRAGTSLRRDQKSIARIRHAVRQRLIVPIRWAARYRIQPRRAAVQRYPARTRTRRQIGAVRSFNSHSQGITVRIPVRIAEDEAHEHRLALCHGDIEAGLHTSDGVACSSGGASTEEDGAQLAVEHLVGALTGTIGALTRASRACWCAHSSCDGIPDGDHRAGATVQHGWEA